MNTKSALTRRMEATAQKIIETEEILKKAEEAWAETLRKYQSFCLKGETLKAPPSADQRPLRPRTWKVAPWLWGKHR